MTMQRILGSGLAVPSLVALAIPSLAILAVPSHAALAIPSYAPSASISTPKSSSAVQLVLLTTSAGRSRRRCGGAISVKVGCVTVSEMGGGRELALLQKCQLHKTP